ncbi:hypothetical protein [Nocardia alni]|uniref:hypothetical protein n=1 Tax=Nocardia alni TaxID=2815723 RepID=UPI001C21749C|nr:hypothetical protein [Nocardia alni]
MTDAARPTVSQARAWDANPLLHQANEWEDAHDHLARHTRTASDSVDESTEYWRGAAGDAMRNRHLLATTAAQTIQTALWDGATAARRGYQQISDANTTALQAINLAELDGYELAEDGTVTVRPVQVAAARALGSGKSVIALAALDQGALTHTAAVQSALAGLGAADGQTSAAINSAFTPLQAMDIAAPMRTGWISWLTDALVIVATIPLDDIGVGEGIDAATIAAMRQVGKDAAEQAAKKGASKDEAVQAGKDAMRKYAQEHAAGSAWKSDFDALPKGDQPTVRTVGDSQRLRSLFDKWTKGAQKLPPRGPKVPEVYKNNDGDVIQWRTSSKSGGETIDIIQQNGKILKVHVK